MHIVFCIKARYFKVQNGLYEKAGTGPGHQGFVLKIIQVKLSKKGIEVLLVIYPPVYF